MKKLTSVLLAILILLGSLSFSAFAYNNGEFQLTVKEAIAEHELLYGEKVETNRYYFLMPNGENGEIGEDAIYEEGVQCNPFYEKFAPSWYNEYTTGDAGIYWWDSGVADPVSWTGYKMEKDDAECVFYADVPKAVTTVIFNNNVNGGLDSELPIYWAAYQSSNICCDYYIPGESKIYPDGLDSFDNMIFVVDPDMCWSNNTIPKESHGGEWYYYYGDGCYGTVKNGDVSDCIRHDHDHETTALKTVKDAIAEYEAQTGEKVETNRYYFLMPDGTNGEKGDNNKLHPNGFPESEYYDKYAPSWYNEYTTGDAGIFWWYNYVADPETWPGYVMEKGDSDSVFYADVPKAVTTIIFNNLVNGGTDYEADVFYKTMKSRNIQSEYYDVGESETYPDGLDSFDNMIYVIDPDLCYDLIENHGRPTYGGEWYYYYGNGCYGTEVDGDRTNCIRDDHEHNPDYLYIILSDGTAEITKYTGSATELTIPSTIDGYIVTSISDRAFTSRQSLKSVTIPETVTHIGAWAFKDCLNLAKINIPSSVTSVGGGAFENTYWFATQPVGCVYINDLLYAFKEYAPENTEVVIKDGTTTICDRAFFDCMNIAKVTIPDSVTTIGDRAFQSCGNFDTIVIPDSVTSIGAWAFASTCLTEITIPDSVNTIEERTFYNCYWLTKVVIGNSVTSIGEYAFEYCSNLKSLTIGNSVTSISDYAFGCCVRLPAVEIPDSVKEIADNAFVYCEKLDVIVIPESVTSIGENAFNKIDNVTIYGYDDSYAEKYAGDNNLNFEVFCIDGGVHVPVTTPGYSATNTETGLSDGLHCLSCGEILKEQEELIFADVDGNGVVTIMDATASQRYVADLCEFTSEEWKRANVDHDYEVTIFDVTIIQKVVAKIL